MNALIALSQKLEELAATPSGAPYAIPSLWMNPAAPGEARVVNVDPHAFFLQKVNEIVAAPDETPGMLSSGGEWTKSAVVYNMFVRLTAAWDHDGDGAIGIDDAEDGYRETGTFLKAIALLPYMKRLGVNTVYLLPVTSIGVDGNKGTLGSPYAIKNPYKLDPRLAEPFLGLGVEAEYAAFVEAAHHLGMRVVMEFVFRTAAKDSEWIPDHPNWFYWIDAAVPDRSADPATANGYGNPRFSPEELQTIAARVKRNDTNSLPPPGMEYRRMFSDPPEHAELTGGRYLGTAPDGRTVRVPGAFADWPPDDVQPPWGDVTYLKLYDHPSFNYIAYNTIRVYDGRLMQIDNENRGLWNTIINIIPHYQKNFGIDGVMIDMGHALPKRLKQSIVDRARKINPDFAFWEENFAISIKSRQEGYNAAVGYLWSDEHLPLKLREFCHMLTTQDVPVPFFATPENHNTPRASSRPGGHAFARMVLTLNAFMPAVYFLHQGVELGETRPVNTGLGFTPAEIAALPSQLLPLFSEASLCWDNPEEMTALVATLAAIRARWELVITDPRRESFHLLHTSDPMALGFARSSVDGAHALAVLLNMDCAKPAKTSAHFTTARTALTDELTGASLTLKAGDASVTLAPGQVMVIELTEPLV